MVSPKSPAGLVADIERFSVQDGPGIRTVVFLKGCPLHCIWCHNPECISFEPETLFYEDKCLHCGQCARGCYAGARVLCGRTMSVSEVMEEIVRDKPYYGSRGGVTFSGGEPQCQKEFLAALAEACRKEGIPTAIETSMIVYEPQILSRLDLIMADIKLMDPDKHLAYTGGSLPRILENIRQADTLGVPILIHTPVVPGINADRQTISAIRDFLIPMKNVIGYELLAYHPLGVAKSKALGRPEPRFQIPGAALMKELKTYADLSRQTDDPAGHETASYPGET